VSEQLSIELPPEPRASWTARLSLGQFAAALSPEALADLRVVVSELVTNSVRHGPGNPIELRVALEDDGLVRGEVVDQGSGTVAIRGSEAVSGGFGLRIVDALCERWGVFEGSTHVWFELRDSATTRD
jgi:anti-sigma regulatory factor (Ser/Thr protein kinase)